MSQTWARLTHDRRWGVCDYAAMKTIIIPISPQMRTALAQLASARKKLRSAQAARQPPGSSGELEDNQKPPAQNRQDDRQNPRRGEKTSTTGIAAGLRNVQGLGDKSGVNALTSRRKK